MRKTIWCSGEIHNDTVLELQENEYWQVKSGYEGTQGWYLTIEKLVGAAHDAYSEFVKREATKSSIALNER